MDGGGYRFPCQLLSLPTSKLVGEELTSHHILHQNKSTKQQKQTQTHQSIALENKTNSNQKILYISIYIHISEARNCNENFFSVFGFECYGVGNGIT